MILAIEAITARPLLFISQVIINLCFFVKDDFSLGFNRFLQSGRGTFLIKKDSKFTKSTSNIYSLDSEGKCNKEKDNYSFYSAPVEKLSEERHGLKSRYQEIKIPGYTFLK